MPQHDDDIIPHQDETEQVIEQVLAEGRNLLLAKTDRTATWNPSTTAKLDNTDLSPVVLTLPEPGLYLVGFEAYFKSTADGTPAQAEADIVINKASRNDPFHFPNDFKGKSVTQDTISLAGQDWLSLSALFPVLITESATVAAFFYANTGTINAAVRNMVPLGDKPTLYAAKLA